MFGLFEKKNPKDQVEKCLRKEDWDGLCRAYYDLGTAAMDSGDLNKAVLWLNRADTIYSASDPLFEKTSKNRLFHKEIVSDCSDRIGTLEEAPIFYNRIPEEIEEKAEALSDSQIRMWGLLAISHLVTLGESLGRLPGCGVLGCLGAAVDIMFRSFQGPISQDEYEDLSDICSDLYELGDSVAFYSGSEISVPGGAPFQVFDLNGMMGVHLELSDYLDNHLRMLSALSEGQEPPAAESSVVGCVLLPDYYVRTGAEDLDEVPQIKAELERIESDYDFVCSGASWEQAFLRAKMYQTLDILQKP